jgi:hypothetical protein
MPVNTHLVKSIYLLLLKFLAGIHVLLLQLLLLLLLQHPQLFLFQLCFLLEQLLLFNLVVESVFLSLLRHLDRELQLLVFLLL